MDRALILVSLIIFVLLILAIGFNWVNKNFNDASNDFGAQRDGALMKIEIKSQLLSELLKWIHENKLSNIQAQEKLGINNKTMANITNNRLEVLSIDMLTHLIIRSGKKVSVKVCE